MLDFNQVTDTIKTYFTQLNEMETYGWIAVCVGLLLVIAGIFFYF